MLVESQTMQESAFNEDNGGLKNFKDTIETEDETDTLAPLGYFDRELAELKRMRANSQAVPIDKIYRFKSGASYTGQWKNHARHGFGVQIWPDGACYEGQWEDNAASGKGKFTHSDGDIFIGKWKANTANGDGTYFHLDSVQKESTIYRGQWHNDIQDGVGVEERTDGSKYEGAFKDGSKNGEGIYYWPDGSKCLGRWRENVIEGQAAYESADGRVFRGQWKQSVITGLGMYTYPDGKCYKGGYATDMKHGFGVFRWPDGRCYQGFWAGGKQNGNGWYTASDGSVRNGDWQETTPTSAVPAAWSAEAPDPHWRWRLCRRPGEPGPGSLRQARKLLSFLSTTCTSWSGCRATCPTTT